MSANVKQLRTSLILAALSLAASGAWADGTQTPATARPVATTTGATAAPKASKTAAGNTSATPTANATAMATTTAATAPAAHRYLDLRAPDIEKVMPYEEIHRGPLLMPEDTEVQDLDTVQVRARSNTPNIPGGFGALAWGFTHPGSIWRILTPVQ